MVVVIIMCSGSITTRELILICRSLNSSLFRILLADQRFVDMRDDTTASDRRLDQTVQLLVSSDGQLQVPGSDTLHLQVLGRVSGQLEDLRGCERKIVNNNIEFPATTTKCKQKCVQRHLGN